MDIKAIKEQGNFLYSKGSTYIASTFVVTWLITEFIAFYSDTYIGLAVALLISPIELGMYRALSKAYSRKGRDVKTKEYVLAGLKEYPKYAPIFVGKKVFIWGVEIAIMAVCALALGKIGELPTLISGVFSGSLVSNSISSMMTGGLDTGLTVGLFFAAALAEIVGFILNIYYAFTFFYAVDRDEFDLWDSLKYSRISMQGNVINYCKLAITFVVKYLIAAFLIAAFVYGFTELNIMCQGYTPDLIDQVLNVVFNVINAFCASIIPAVLYKIKWMLALYVMYRKIADGEEE